MKRVTDTEHLEQREQYLGHLLNTIQGHMSKGLNVEQQRPDVKVREDPLSHSRC